MILIEQSENCLRCFHKEEVGGRSHQVFLCRRVLHPWVSVRRRLTFAAADADEMPTTSKRGSAPHAVMEQLQRCASTVGQRSPTDPELE